MLSPPYAPPFTSWSHGVKPIEIPEDDSTMEAVINATSVNDDQELLVDSSEATKVQDVELNETSKMCSHRKVCSWRSSSILSWFIIVSLVIILVAVFVRKPE